ncbi:MAG: mechanosensitive ion channel family protein [Sphingomonadaceae bacterium]
MNDWIALAIPELVEVAKMIVGALLAVIIGRWLIGILVGWTRKALEKRAFDPTITRYLVSLASIVLNIFLIIGVLSLFGIETTSFAALIAALGLAVGVAWSGMLANFASGVFLILFKPFKVGDFVTAGGTTGTVKEIGMFATTIATLDNIFTVVGNGKIAAETISNFSTYEYRAVDLRAQIAHGVNPIDAIARLQPAIAAIPNTTTDPAPTIEILEFNTRGTMLVVRPFTNNAHYWQVYFDTNRAIAETMGAAGYAVPAEHIVEYERKG